jgi:hypothetical protein
MGIANFDLIITKHDICSMLEASKIKKLTKNLLKYVCKEILF